MMVKIIILIIVLLIVLIFPFNEIHFISDNSGIVRISRIERKSIILNYGTFLTPGLYDNLLFKPSTYINPWYIDTGPLDDGCFELYAEFKGDTICVYNGSYCQAKNLNSKFQLITVSNAIGDKNWFTISNDKTERFLPIDCNTGMVK